MRNIDFVLYTSKHCNLRCSYCYELPLLSDRRRMQHQQLQRMFAHVREYLDQQAEPVQVRFQWHGGEPLLLPPDYYHAAFEGCAEIFQDSPHRVQHTVQTNLTILDDARLTLLKSGFDSVGVSLDVCSGLRVNKLGVDQENRTHDNLERLLAAGVRPDGITVLSRANLKHMARIYDFYRDRKMNFRILPLEKGMYEAGQPFELSPQDILNALCELADMWFADAQTVLVQPLIEHIQMLVAARARPTLRVVHDKRAWEPVLQVDTDGRLYGYTSYLDDAHALGNLFQSPLLQLLGGVAHHAQIEVAEARVRSACNGCEFLGRGCTGYPIAESEVSFLDRRTDGQLECSVVKPLLSYLEKKLTEGGVFDALGQVTPAMRAAQEVRHGA